MLGFTALHIGRLDEAEQALEAVYFDPNSPEAMQLLGQVFTSKTAERGLEPMRRASGLKPMRARI